MAGVDAGRGVVEVGAREMRRLGLNTDEDGCCRCLKANYYKMGLANFTRELLGKKDGFIATAIIEIRDEEDAGDKH